MVPSQLKEYQRTQRSRLKGVHCRRTAAQLTIPLVGECQTIQTNRAFDPLFFLGALSKLLGPIKETRVLTWTIHEVGVDELLTMIGSIDLGSIVLKARPESIKEVQVPLQTRGHKCQTTKTRAKVILVETHQKTFISIKTQPSPDGEVHEVSSDPLVWGQLSSLFESS